MFTRLIISALVSFILVHGYAQLQIQTIPINSAAIDDQLNLLVYQPDSYETSEKSYPVLYVLDGQWFFYNGVGIQETLRGENVMPEMLVVGIDFKNRSFRDSLLQVNWSGVLKLVNEEVPRLIHDRYRSANEQVLFGWEQNASLACQSILIKDTPFQGAVISNGGSVDGEVITNYATNETDTKYLFVANSKNDIYTRASTEDLVNHLKQFQPSGIKWKYQSFDEEVHESLPYVSLYQGLRFFYHNYSAYIISDTRDFFDEGGMPALKQYFKERGERFGLDTEINNSTKNMLIWLAWKQDDFRSFDYFMKEFEEVLSTSRYASAYWQSRLGTYYYTNEAYQKAINHFDIGITNYPDPEYLAQMYQYRGHAHLQLGHQKEGRLDLKKADELRSLCKETEG